MKILKEWTTKGKRRMTIELGEGETLVSVQKHEHYRLGYPLEEVVRADQIMEARHVMWCVASQKWVE